MKVPVTLVVNGQPRSVTVDSRMLLADMLRDELRLTGTHIGCATGNCGACTVEMGGRTVKSCCILAADADGEEVLTIEGLSTSPEDLHPIQQAFISHQGLQCGYCTPGMILAARALLAERPRPDRGRDPARHLRQPLPLYRLPLHRGVYPGGRTRPPRRACRDGVGRHGGGRLTGAPRGRQMTSVRVAAIQTGPASEDRAANLAHVATIVRGLDPAPELVVLPELFAHPFWCVGLQDPAYFAWAESLDGPTVMAMAALATSVGCHIVAPLFERGEREGEFYNSAALVAPDGSLVPGTLPDGRIVRAYRKNAISSYAWDGHRNDEKFYFRPGDGFPCSPQASAASGCSSVTTVGTPRPGGSSPCKARSWCWCQTRRRGTSTTCSYP